jgi:hypothetical protein
MSPEKVGNCPEFQGVSIFLPFSLFSAAHPVSDSKKHPPVAGRGLCATVIASMVLTLSGCGGEPSEREVRNARAFEALLSAVSLKNPKELEQDARLIDERHAAGEMSEGRYKEIREIVDKARARDWAGAERRAYEFRNGFGERQAYFR